MHYFKEFLTGFNFYYDIKFWMLFILAVVVLRFLVYRRRERSRNIAIALFSIVFLMALPRFTPMTFVFMLAVSSAVYLIGRALNSGREKESGNSKLLLAVFTIGSLILILSFFKYRFLQELVFGGIFGRNLGSADIIFIIGISYSSFKMMHFIIECYKGQAEKIDPLYFFNYIFFFPSFISGPINRYNHFSEQMRFEIEPEIGKDMKSGLERIIHGLFKKFVLSTIVFPYAITNIAGPVSAMSASDIIIGLYAYTLYFYFDFAGYSDLAIGSARVLGVELPENFNNPFMKCNIQQLWANWHISLTSWLTDYIYWPLSRKLRNFSFFRKRPITLSNVSIIVTFIICGMWHGDTFNFILWGFYQGIGLAALNIYRKQKRKVRNKRLRKYFKSRYSEAVGVFGTFNFFALGIFFFVLRKDEIVILVSRLLGFIFK